MSKILKKRQGFSLFLNNSMHDTEHCLHTSNAIAIILKIACQKYKKRPGFLLFLNNSMHVTEHFLHTSNEILIILKITIQKYSKTTGKYMFFINSIGVTEQNFNIREGFSIFSSKHIEKPKEMQ